MKYPPWCSRFEDRKYAVNKAAEEVGVDPYIAAEAIGKVFKKLAEGLNCPTMPMIRFTNKVFLRPSPKAIFRQIIKNGMFYRRGAMSKEKYIAVTWPYYLARRRVLDAGLKTTEQRKNEALFWTNHMRRILPANIEAVKEYCASLGEGTLFKLPREAMSKVWWDIRDFMRYRYYRRKQWKHEENGNKQT